MAENDDRGGRTPQRRCLQQVLTLSQKKEVVEFMTTSEALEGGRRLIPRTIAAFPHYFRGSYGANYSRVSRWWEDQENLLSLGDNANPSPLIVTRSHFGKLSKQHVKTRGGRGRKTQLWVLWLFGRMHDEFDRLRKTGIYFLN